MIANKHINQIVLAVTAFGLALIFLAMCFSSDLASAVGDSGGLTMDYESELFDTSDIISIDIQMEEDDWNDLLENAIDEQYYPCDVVINGTTFHDVGIRAKGNTSLSSVYNDPDTQRYSFKLKFDEYVDGQTCFGLDKLVLNNNYADATSMKEAIAYDMFAYLGADASLYNYASISVNGTYWGCYLALEAVEESFALRNYGTDYGDLYKPEAMGVGGAGAMKNFDEDDLKKLNGQADTEEDNSADSSTDNSTKTTQANGNGGGQASTGLGPRGAPGENANGGAQNSTSGTTAQDNDGDTNDTSSTQPQQAPGNHQGGGNGGQMGGNGGGTSSGKGADLNYSDDDLDSYSTIWDGEVFKTTKADHRRVVTALKNISEDNDLETYLDVDNMLRYLAVQTFVVNLDSLTGSMAHNYYLYEDNGQLNLIPWDYNLSFGGFQSSSASSTVNFPIDTPFTTGLADREFFAALLENDEYLEQYHTYLRQLAEEYVDGGVFAKTVSRIRSQIDGLVSTDPTAFYTADEYSDAVSMLEKVVQLRAQSVLGQLDGTIPSTTDGQKENSSTLIDCSGIDLSVMGTMTGNQGGGQMGGRNAQAPQGNADQQTAAGQNSPDTVDKKASENLAE